ncbi:AlpA family transcriptional regulator [Modicisalibacter tunisiensis]|uniref:AlpA family transcriptional regulator n=1 Tax=Modicisalibacter tunisiensis TaxID=390637 RepID=UPI001CC9F4E1|nr:AlpA family transcriptional regulator [Modicisalibacter tunisiensis]MBZ9539649.1 AlpA family transcriptional regulator [Modicisalibacter tunisiensis]
MRLLKLKDVLFTTGLGRSTVYKYISEGHFPRPVSLGERNVAWVEDEIQEWILEKIAKRDAEALS